MKCEGPQDFELVRQEIKKWRKRHPMFKHDIDKLSNVIEQHITQYSTILIDYRRTKRDIYLDKANIEIDKINKLLNAVGKVELMAILSQG